MNKKKLFFVLISLNTFVCSKIRIVCTAALIPDNYETRKQQYIESLTNLTNFGHKPYVVESVQGGPTFLDSYCDQVCYTHSNNAILKNKGVNEVMSLLIGLKYFNFDPEDIVIKLTGRYPLRSDEFIRLVENHPDLDACVRMWSDTDAYSGLFAMKVKYLIDMLSNLDLRKIEQENSPVEWSLGAYITNMKQSGAKIVPLEKVYEYLPVCSQFLPHRKTEVLRN